MSGKNYGHQTGHVSAFAHVPLAAWPGYCLELPRSWLQERSVIDAYTASEPRLVYEPAWWPLLKHRVEEALASWQAGNPGKLAALITRVPPLFGRLEIAEALRVCVSQRDKSLLNRIIEAMPDQIVTPEVLARHDRLSQLAAVSRLVKEGGSLLGGEAPTTKRQQQFLVAKEENIGLSAVEKVPKRISEKGLAFIPKRCRVCSEHANHLEIVDHPKTPDPQFDLLHLEWPTADEISQAQIRTFVEIVDGRPTTHSVHAVPTNYEDKS